MFRRLGHGKLSPYVHDFLDEYLKNNMLNDAVDFSQVKTVLVIKLLHLGDTLLTFPVFTVLKAHYFHLEIDALINTVVAATRTLIEQNKP